MTNAHALIFTFIRDTLADPELDFKMVVKKLSTHPISALCYVTVGGVQSTEGVVIIRARNQVQDLWWIGGKHWFLIQVNADHWKPSDNPSGAVRKEAATKRMNQIGQKNLSLSGMLDSVLCVPPIMRNITLQVISMSAPIPEHYQQWSMPAGLKPSSSTMYICTLYNQQPLLPFPVQMHSKYPYN